ncbi:hypothetical protein HS088_TW10G00038 [Tripterygium wilfordii]|uniref:RRM domain-containing protein n=1 Tax=Tripterygium wilfordii TaxID=458696 RepID=A0A7J7D400_TRIWF|nr:uncharacterized protein LOC120007571 [Tripterygium wilfordii]KAF5741043.1 hypothetical protein HS088_TW10G00038 [Tripterygium wilfordii]
MMMLSSTTLQTPFTFTNTTSLSLQNPNKTHRLQFLSRYSPTQSSFFRFCIRNASFVSSSQYSQKTHIFCDSILDKRVKDWRVSALNKGDGDDGEDEEYSSPFEWMETWMENKPTGFGEGKVYDTSIEDALVEEIEHSRRVQLANVNKLKHNPILPGPKKDGTKKKGNKNHSKDPENGSITSSKQISAVIPSGVRVRIINLPKKRNIQRDLKSAFKGVHGILNITPAVSGNKKTRDPICKGFAFVDLKAEEDATRFIHSFSGQSIVFGKMQKQIKCEIVNSSSPNSVSENFAKNTYDEPKPVVPSLEQEPYIVLDVDESSVNLRMEAASDESDESPDDLDIEKLDDVRENVEFVTASEGNTGSSPANRPEGIDALDNKVSAKESKEKFMMSDNLESSDPLERIKALEERLLAREKAFLKKSRTKAMEENDTILEVPGSSNKQKKVQAPRKKLVAAKDKVKKGPPVLEASGSSKRLKIKEKAMLTDVLSRYGAKSALAGKEKS